MARGYLPGDLMGDRRASAYHLTVYAALESFCSVKQRMCYPSQTLLLQRARCSERKLRSCLRDLESWGYVRVVRRVNGNLKSRNQYLLRPAHGADRQEQHQTDQPAHGADRTGTSDRNNRHRVPVLLEGTQGRREGLTPKDSPPTRKTVSRKPPTLGEVTAHLEQKVDAGRAALEAQAFIDYYESNGWRVGRNPMKSWKAAASGWLRRSLGRGENDATGYHRQNAAPVGAGRDYFLS